MKYGIDIAARRFDDLDKIIIEECKEGNTVLEAGCGSGALATALTAKGAHVTGVDIIEMDSSAFKYIHGDIREVIDELSEITFDAVVMQRVIHYLPYIDALILLRKLKELSVKKLYISVSGMESEIGNHYENRPAALDERHGQLTALGKDLFEITEPVTLYSKEEFETLLEDADWTIERCWTSAFGNHKAICF